MSFRDPLDDYERTSGHRMPYPPAVQEQFAPITEIHRFGATSGRIVYGYAAGSGRERYPEAEVGEMCVQLWQVRGLPEVGHPLGQYETKAVGQP